MAGDIQLTCSDCGQDFTFTAADQAFFQERGYSGTGNTCHLLGLRTAYNSAF